MIDTLKETCPTNSEVLSFDEKGRTPVKKFGGSMWLSEKYYYIPYNQKVKGLFDLFAAKNIHSGEIHYRFYDFKNSFIVIDMFEYLLSIYPDKHLYIILDNWSAHRSNVIKIFEDLNPRVTLVYLPFSASWMNDIERDFSRIERQVLKNSNFSSVREVMTAIKRFINYG